MEAERLDETGVAWLFDRSRADPPGLVVPKAFGGPEEPVVAAPAAAGPAVAAVNPRQVRDFAKHDGQPATTDTLAPPRAGP